MKRKYGWKRQSLDIRDKVFEPKFVNDADLPDTVDLRSSPYMPDVYDQGDVGSCTAQAIAGAVSYDRRKQNLPSLGVTNNPSRLFIYYNEREFESTPTCDLTNQDSGAQIRDGIKVVASLGVCDEALWPYDIENGFAKLITKPTDDCYAAALNDVVVRYEAINQDAMSIMSALAQGLPVVAGFVVYEEFESSFTATTGELTMPSLFEDFGWKKPIGGHAILIVGYDKKAQKFIIRNSWGTSWGLKGYFTAPFDYFTNPKLASDFWCIQCISA